MNILLHHKRRLYVAKIYYSVYNSITTICWNCGTNILLPDNLICPNNKCNVIQLVDMKKINPFSLFNIESKYFINNEILDQNFKNIQKVFHPDKFVNKTLREREISNEMSSIVNQLYQILKIPMSRAEYIYKITFNHNAFNENSNTANVVKTEFMKKIFSIREIIEDTNQPSELLTILPQLELELKNIEIEFNRSIIDHNENNAIQSILQLKYYFKVSIFYFITMIYCIS